MDEIFKKAFEVIFSQAGGIGILLVCGNLYLARELGKEREEHAKTREKLEALSEKSITSSVETVTALGAMKSAIEMLVGFVQNATASHKRGG